MSAASEVTSSAKEGIKISTIVTFIVAFVVVNAILSIMDTLPYASTVSAFIRNPVAVIKAKISPPAAS